MDEEIINALKKIQKICTDNTVDCNGCPFQNSNSRCELQNKSPEEWKINDNVIRYLL